jgi:hypothetical protein
VIFWRWKRLEFLPFMDRMKLGNIDRVECLPTEARALPSSKCKMSAWMGDLVL